MAEHRFCYCTFRGEGKTTEIADLYVNGDRRSEFKHGFEFLDAMSKEGFELIQHAVGQKGTSYSHHHFTFRKG